MPRTSASFSPNPTLRIAPGQAVAGSSSLSTLTAPFDQDDGPTAQAWQGLGRLIDTLDHTLRLPSTPRAFMHYMAALILVFTGALLHVIIAAQVMAAKIELAELKREDALIEQLNGDLIFRIARGGSLTRVQEEAISRGYVPATEHDYVLIPTEPAPAMAAAPAQPAAQPAPVVTTPPTTPVIDHGTQAPWRAWTDFLGLPAPSDWPQARPEDTRGDSSRPDLLNELGKQLERFGIR